MKNICELAFERMQKEDIDHHESDLYLRVNHTSSELINEYDYKWMVTKFIDNIDHVLWYEVPFAWTGTKQP